MNRIYKTEFEARMENEYKLFEMAEKNLNFRSSTLDKLSKIVNIEQMLEENKFKEGFPINMNFIKKKMIFLKN